MKKIVAIAAAGMFAFSFAAQAEQGSCYGNSRTVSTPKPATSLETVSTPVATPAVTVLDTVTKPDETPNTDG